MKAASSQVGGRSDLKDTRQRPALELAETANDGASSKATLLTHDDARVGRGLHEEMEGGDDGRFVDRVRRVDVLRRGRGRTWGAYLMEGNLVRDEELLTEGMVMMVVRMI